MRHHILLLSDDFGDYCHCEVYVKILLCILVVHF